MAERIQWRERGLGEAMIDFGDRRGGERRCGRVSRRMSVIMSGPMDKKADGTEDCAGKSEAKKNGGAYINFQRPTGLSVGGAPVVWLTMLDDEP